MLTFGSESESELVKISSTPISLCYVQYCVSGCGVVEFDLPTTVLQKRGGKGLEFEFVSQP